MGKVAGKVGWDEEKAEAAWAGEVAMGTREWDGTVIGIGEE